MILRFLSRLCYLAAILSWLLAAAPRVEALGFRYEILQGIRGAELWAWLMLGGVVLATCGAVLGGLASIRSDCRQIKTLLTRR